MAALAVLLGACVPEVEDFKAPPNPFNLKNFNASTLATGDGTKGFVVEPYIAQQLGFSVSLGNFNGDGFADVAIGTPAYGGGMVYVLTGHAAPFSPIISADNANVRLYGVAGAGAGTAVMSVGDVSGDGFEDLAIGMPDYSSNDGAVAILFGGSTLPGSGTLNSTFFDGSGSLGNLFDTFGYTDRVGNALAPAGNLVGDTKLDFIVGAPYFSEYYSYGGQAIVVDGAITGDPVFGDMNPGSRAQRLMGVGSNYRLGYSVAGGGDVNGDGRTDVLVGAPGVFYTTISRAYLVFAESTTGGVQTIVPGASSVFTLAGTISDSTGAAVALGNLNGDGFADLIIGAPDAGSGYTGRVTVVFGGPGLGGMILDASSMNGTNGFNIWGADIAEGIGQSLAFAGDMNGDGYPDLLIGSSHVAFSGPPYYMPYNIARAYVIFGGPGPWPANIYLSQLSSSQGIVIQAVNNNWGENPVFAAVAGGRDVDGDGLPDVVLGEIGYNFGQGRVFVIFNKALQ